MRRPRNVKDKSTPTEPAGGRAWQRVQQFNLARGLPTSPTPTGVARPPAIGKTSVKAAAKTRSSKARTAAKKSRVTPSTRSRRK